VEVEVEVATAGEGSSSLLLNPLRFAHHLPPPLVVEAEVSKGVGAFKRVEASKGVALEASKGLGAFKEAQVAAAPRLPWARCPRGHPLPPGGVAAAVAAAVGRRHRRRPPSSTFTVMFVWLKWHVLPLTLSPLPPAETCTNGEQREGRATPVVVLRVRQVDPAPTVGVAVGVGVAATASQLLHSCPRCVVSVLSK